MVTTNVVDLRVLNQAPDLRLLQVVQAIVVGGSQVGAHTPVVASDHHTAAARGLGGLDAVLDAEPDLLDGILEDACVLVVADAANEHDTVIGQHVLGASGGVLRGTAGDQLRLVVVQQLLIQRLVLLLGQDRVVSLQAILRKEFVAANSLDVCGWDGWTWSVRFKSSRQRCCTETLGG